MVTYRLLPPYDIGPRLMPSVRLSDGSRVSIEAEEITGDGRVRWHYVIDGVDGTELLDGNDMQSGRGDAPEDVANAFQTLASFLSAWVEALHYGEASENYDLFPQSLADWAEANADELSMLVETEEEGE